MPDRRAILLGALSLFPAAASAQDGAPLQLVRRFYQPGFDERTLPMSRALRQLFLAAKARSDREEGPVAGLDFSWTVGAQDVVDDFERSLAIKTVVQTLGSAVVEVRFRNPKPQIVQYRMIREGGRWVVDDIEYLTARERLAKLFAKGAKGES